MPINADNDKKRVFSNSDQRLIILAAVVFIMGAVLVAVSLGSAVYFKPGNISAARLNQSYAAAKSENKCNAAGISLRGELVTYIPKTDLDASGNLTMDETSADDVYAAVKNAEKNENIKAIVLEVDSPGGEPVAAEELAGLFKNSAKPVIAYIRNIGASAAYWAATGAKVIFASPSSQIGSIAIDSSYLDKVKNNGQNGYTYHELATGKFKNTGDENKPLSAEEQALIMKDLYATHDLFVNTVAANRKLDVNKVKEIANGWAYTGADSLQLGLIDKLGGLDDVKNYLRDNILHNQEVSICW